MPEAPSFTSRSLSCIDVDRAFSLVELEFGDTPLRMKYPPLFFRVYRITFGFFAWWILLNWRWTCTGRWMASLRCTRGAQYFWYLARKIKMLALYCDPFLHRDIQLDLTNSHDPRSIVGTVKRVHHLPHSSHLISLSKAANNPLQNRASI